MALARSNTTNSRSRSHASSSQTSLPNRPFLPPSHYAAAGGLKPTTRNENRDSTEWDAHISTENYSDDQALYPNAFMPVAYPSESSASVSSFEFTPRSEYRAIATSNVKPPTIARSNSRGKRPGHMAGLPLLEAQLLPSLRDTIDRMTRSPSRVTSPTAYTVPNIEPTKHSHNAQSPLGTPNLSYCSSSDAKSPQTPYTPRTPHMPSSRLRSGATTPTDITTPKTKLPPKSALKSALRAPTPKQFSGSSPTPETFLQSPPGGSLVSCRNALARKSSMATPSLSMTTSDDTARKSASKDSSQSNILPTRARSRTDPGTIVGKQQPATNAYAVTPQPSSSIKSKSDAKENIFSSSIPRPHVRFDASKLAIHADESDLEFRFESEGRDNRKLRVINAEIVPASSSSGSDIGPSQSRPWGKETKMKTDREKWGQLKKSENSHGERAVAGVGLGFDMGGGRNKKASVGQFEDSVSRQGDREWRQYHAQRKELPPTPASTIHPSYSSDSIHLMQRDNNDKSYINPGDQDKERRKRRDALMGIVNGLDLSSGDIPFSRESVEGSEYCGEDGLAISGSGDPRATIHPECSQPSFTSKEKSVYGKEKTQHRWKPWVDERPRSSSCTPTLLVSKEEGVRIPRHRTSSASPAQRPTSANRWSIAPVASSQLPRLKVDAGTKGRKSPSRSPVVRQNEPVPMPAALIKHSVYHGLSNPNNNPQYDDLGDSDAVIIAQRSHEAAMRERQAFGIPPSESDEVYQYSDQAHGLPQAESILSSIGSANWQDDWAELSAGAETLFKKINTGKTKEKEPDWRSQLGLIREPRKSVVDERRATPQREVQSPSPMSSSSSASSVYEDQGLDVRYQKGQGSHYMPHEERHARSSWRPDPSPSSSSDDEGCGEMEMKRQDIIREIYETEEAFVNRLNVAVQLFILPLRVQHSKAWISGVPPDIARLLDWLEDIFNLHCQIISSMKSTIASYSHVVERFAESIRTYVSRLEVYQPYLVRLTDVASLIEQLLDDETSDFGEFVQMQEGVSDCDGWKLEMFLVEPVTRLAKYPEFFSKLLSLTPKNHPDYLSTLSLVHSTNMVITVMTEVKLREDEYDRVKNISEHLQGLPESVQLAKRERRLIHQGILYLIDNDNEMIHPAGTTEIPRPFQDILSISKQMENQKLPKRSKRPSEVIDECDGRRGRSGSIKSTTPSSTGGSVDPDSTTLGSSGYLATQSSSYFPDSRFPRSYCKQATNGRTEVKAPLQVQAFVFSDLFILATFLDTRNDATEEWILLKDLGISKILGVSELASNDRPLFLLEVVPVQSDNLNQDILTNDATIQVLHLAIQNKPSTPDEEKRQLWLSAFQQCSRCTLRSISLPPHSGAPDPSLDLVPDTRQSLYAMLASGLPFPKSPSTQISDVQSGQPSDATKQEREARGWWSLRFQQVLREIQRQH